MGFEKKKRKLPIEVGRWSNIPREQRICTLCNLQKIGDEFHYLFECSHNDIFHARLKFIPKNTIKGQISSNFNSYLHVQILCNLRKFQNF